MNDEVVWSAGTVCQRMYRGVSVEGGTFVEMGGVALKLGRGSMGIEVEIGRSNALLGET